MTTSAKTRPKSKPKTMLIEIDRLQLDDRTQLREGVDDDMVKEYQDHLDDLPPIDAFLNGKTTAVFIGDGHHRALAHVAAGRKKIACIIHQGDMRDAILWACSANGRHGKRRSNQDKRKAVLTLLKDAEWTKKSDHWVAQKCAVSHTFVGNLRTSTGNVSSSRESQDGKSRDVSGISKSNSRRTETAPPSETPPCPTCGSVQRDEDGDCASCREPADSMATTIPMREPGDDSDVIEQEKAEAAARKGEVLDCLKQPVAENLRQTFLEVPDFRSAMRAISDAKSKSLELCKRESGGWIDAQELERLLEQAHALVRFAMPYTECHKCRRKTKKACPACKGTGWVTETMYRTSASDADKQWLSEARK